LLFCWEMWWNAASSITLRSHSTSMTSLLWNMVQRLTDLLATGMLKMIAEFNRFMDSMIVWTIPDNVSYLTPFLIKLAENLFGKFNFRGEYLDHVILFLRIAETKLTIFSGRKIELFPCWLVLAKAFINNIGAPQEYKTPKKQQVPRIKKFELVTATASIEENDIENESAEHVFSEEYLECIIQKFWPIFSKNLVTSLIEKTDPFLSTLASDSRANYLRAEENALIEKIGNSVKYISKIKDSNPELTRKMFTLNISRYALQPVLLDIQKHTPFDLLKTPLEDVPVGIIEWNDPHRSLTNLILCGIEGNTCWVGHGRIWPDLFGGETIKDIDDGLTNMNLNVLKGNQLSTMINSTLHTEAKTMLLRLLLATGRVEDAIGYCLKDKSQRFRLPSIFLAVTNQSNMGTDQSFGESLNRSMLSATFRGFNSKRVEELYVSAMTDTLTHSAHEVDDILQSADMFIPSGAHRLRAEAAKTLLARAKTKLIDTSPFERFKIDEGLLVDRLRRAILRPPKTADIMEPSIIALVDVITVMSKCDLKEIYTEYERQYRKDVVIEDPINETARVYVEPFHVLCQYLWYTHLKISMQQLMNSVNPFHTIYRPQSDATVDIRQREQQLLNMARYALELLPFSNLHNKITLQGSLLTILSLVRDLKGLASIIAGIDESDIVISLRRRLDLLKERAKTVEIIEPPISQYWNSTRAIVEMLTSERIRNTLTKDSLGAIGTEKFGVVAKSIRKMSFKKIPLMLTPTTPLSNSGTPLSLGTPTVEKKKGFMQKIPSLKAFIGMTIIKKSNTLNLTPNIPKMNNTQQVEDVVLDVVGEDEVDQNIYKDAIDEESEAAEEEPSVTQFHPQRKPERDETITKVDSPSNAAVLLNIATMAIPPEEPKRDLKRIVRDIFMSSKRRENEIDSDESVLRRRDTIISARRISSLIDETIGMKSRSNSTIESPQQIPVPPQRRSQSASGLRLNMTATTLPQMDDNKQSYTKNEGF
jgi:hypothetical protein